MSKENNVTYKFNKKKCCGCEVCVDVCPTNAIRMEIDEEGFSYPKIDKNKCINCGKCINICPIKNPKNIWNQFEISIPFAVKHRNEYVRTQSRSGGIFSALTDIILERKGVIYGCILDKNFKACHFRTENSAGRDKMRGSKYVQSKMTGISKSILQDLKDNRWVLYSGTSCQVQAIRQAIPLSLQNKLILVDLVCHGVPSPKIWKDYLDYVSKLYNGNVTKVDFRNKNKYGWKDHVETIEIDGKEYDSKIYTNLFYNHVILRPSCFECPYKDIHRPGDITIADFWGIDNAVKNFNDDKGVSLVLINNEKGMKLFELAKKDINFERVELENCMQPPLKGNFIEPSSRKRFWKLYNKKEFSEVIKIYGEIQKVSFIDKVRRKLNKIIKH